MVRIRGVLSGVYAGVICFVLFCFVCSVLSLLLGFRFVRLVRLFSSCLILSVFGSFPPGPSLLVLTLFARDWVLFNHELVATVA